MLILIIIGWIIGIVQGGTEYTAGLFVAAMMMYEKDNDYIPEMPYTTVPVIRREDTFENEGWARVFMKSTGADPEREVRLRLKKSTGQWFLNEEYLLPDIRVPKSADPWA